MTITLKRRNALLYEAKALVLKGWCQGRATVLIFEDGHVIGYNVCAYGALTYGLDSANADFPAMVSAWRALKVAVDKLYCGMSVFAYNDTPGRTKYEVAAMFDHAKKMPL